MSIYDVSPSSDLQAVSAELVPGDTLVFEPGDYNIASTIGLVSGVSYVGQAGVILNATSTNNIMQGVGVANVSISGITFNGGPDVMDGAHGAIFLVDAEAVSINNNTFTNINADGAVLFYQSDDLSIDSNNANNLQEFVSGINNSGIHGNISISDNTISDTSRIAIEVQGSYNNLQVNSNTISGSPGEAISVVAGQSAVSVSVVGNNLSNGLTAIEASDSGMTVTDNVITDFIGGLSIAATPDSDFYDNTFTRVTIPLGEDGGFTDQQWVGTNAIDGVAVTGWPEQPNSSAGSPPASAPPVGTATLAVAAVDTPASPSTPATRLVTPVGTLIPTGTITVGLGPDTIGLTISEDAFQGDAEFIVLINGTQIGGIQTVTAQQGLGQSQIFDVEGAFSDTSNAVSVGFTNDFYGGSPMTDRNLYLLGATYDESGSPGAAFEAPSAFEALLQGGEFTFTVNTPPSSPTTVGFGPDQLQLTLAEQSFCGDTQFAISVDGQQIGDVQTATAIAAAGESQVFDVDGTFGAGNHNVSVTLVNPYGFAGYALAARSLYVEGASLDGTSGFTSTAESSIDLTSGTAASFSVSDTATVPIVLGSGPDTLALFIAEDYYLADAQFTVTVDAQEIGGTQTATAIHGSGQTQEYDVQGNFAPGSHAVSVDFLNDAYGGSASLDRNLYVDAASINGNTIAGSAYEINSTGSLGFSFATPGTPAPVTVGGAGLDTLALNVAEDYYQGNAQFTLSVDGNQVGGTQTATAIQGNGQSQVFDVFGSFSGAHTVTVDFLNDAYGGSPALDRNLYVGSASIDGANITSSSLTLMPQGPQSFTFTH